MFSLQNGGWFGKSLSPLNNNVWNYVVVTYDSLGNYNIYLDGNLSGNGNKLSTFSSVNTIIGSKKGTSEFFNGTIDELIIYDKALSESEISQLYNSGNGVSVDRKSVV